MLRASSCLRCCPSLPCLQDIPVLVSLPSPLPEGVPDEQQYIQAYCTARGLPYPLQASGQGPAWAALPARFALLAFDAGIIGIARLIFTAN